MKEYLKADTFFSSLKGEDVKPIRNKIIHRINQLEFRKVYNVKLSNYLNSDNCT